MPPNREDLVIQRILIRHGFTREMGEELLVEMKRTVEDLKVEIRRAGRGGVRRVIRGLTWLELARTITREDREKIAPGCGQRATGIRSRGAV